MSDLHLFSEAFQCKNVPVRIVPVDESHPGGLHWDGQCKCPKFQKLKHEIIIKANEDGSIVTKEVEIAGCLDHLMPWIQATSIRKTNELSIDVGKLTEETENVKGEIGKIKENLGGLIHLITNQRFNQLSQFPQIPNRTWSGDEIMELLLHARNELHKLQSNGIGRDESPLRVIETHHQVTTTPEISPSAAAPEIPLQTIDGIKGNIDLVW